MIEKLRKNLLFKNFTKEEIERALIWFEAREVVFDKNEVVFHEGDKTEKIGIILEGNVTAERTDAEGNTFIVTNKGKNSTIGETCVITDQPLIVDIIASETTKIVFLTIGKLVGHYNQFTGWRAKFISNLLTVVGDENNQFAHRIIHISPRTIRERVISLFRSHVDKYGSDEFDILLNRQQLADYLNVDRSALSNELSKMRREGLIEFNKNHFKLLMPVCIFEDL